MVDDRQVRGVVEGDALLAVVDVEVVGDHVLAEHEAVAEALRGDVVQNVVVVLVVRHDQPRDVAGIVEQFLFEFGVPDVLGQAELRVLDVRARHVAEVDGALRRVHLVFVEFDGELEIEDRERVDAEPSRVAVALRRGQDRPGARRGVVLLGRRPVREDPDVDPALTAEPGRIVVAVVLRPHLIGIEEFAGHLPLQLDVVDPHRDIELRAQRAPVDLLDPRGRDAVAPARVGEEQFSPAAFGKEVDALLDRGGVVGHAVADRAELKHRITERSHREYLRKMIVIAAVPGTPRPGAGRRNRRAPVPPRRRGV